jgi:predicted aldo/keto reductase-like oxidoreductase
MNRIVVGKTGLEVNQLGIGGIPIQRVDEETAVGVVRHAVEKGVDFIDTARGYTTSERRIGLALKQTDKLVVICSKSHNRESDGIRADLEESLKQLQRDYIDIYMCHLVRDEEDYQKVISPGGAFEGLKRAKEEGLIGHIGMSSHSLDLYEKLLDDTPFETIMVCYSFLEPAAEEKVIPKAIEKGLGVFAMKPFSGGVIENPKIALKYVLSQPGVVVIPGVENKDLFDENWETYQGNLELDEAERQEMDEYLSRYDKVFCRRCDYCQPCSEEIPIQTILGMKSFVKRLGTQFFESPRMKPGIEKARNCSECEECMSRCPYNLPIPELIKKNLAWFDEQAGDTTGSLVP